MGEFFTNETVQKIEEKTNTWVDFFEHLNLPNSFDIPFYTVLAGILVGGIGVGQWFVLRKQKEKRV